MWAMRGLGDRRALQNAHSREALRVRLGRLTADSEACCHLLPKSQTEIGGLPCGAKLLDRDNMCVHPLICQRGAARLRPHRAVTTALGRGIKSTGAEIDYERWIPHLYQQDERGAIRAAQLDIAAVWPGAHALICYDVTIACPSSVASPIPTLEWQ